MRKKPWGAAVLILLAGWMVLLPLWQLADWAKIKREKGDAVQQLYEVAQFQMELLGSTMNEAAAVKTSGQLNEWKRAAYSAAFTHERLVTASAGEALPGKLESMEMLLQWIMRVQLGGERPLKPEELELMKEVAKRYKALFEAYGRLRDKDGDPVSAAAGELTRADRELADVLRKKMK